MGMEHLKAFNKILEPDERQRNFIATFDPATFDYSHMTLDHLYKEAAAITLDETVPEGIRSHFSTVLNLLVYSWFHYPFNVTAQFLAYTTVEMALKEKLKPKKRTSFKILIERAVNEGLVTSAGFSHIKNNEHYPILGVERWSPETNDYCQTLADAMPHLRNELAHGSNMLHPHGAQSVRICAEFINQLFKVSE